MFEEPTELEEREILSLAESLRKIEKFFPVDPENEEERIEKIERRKKFLRSEQGCALFYSESMKILLENSGRLRKSSGYFRVMHRISLQKRY